MTVAGFAIFDTAIGRCGIAWSPRGIQGVALPGSDDRETVAWLLHRCPDVREGRPPPAVRSTIDAIVALLGGERIDLSGVTLDMERLSPFYRRVYDEARGIGPGQTFTYGDIAARLGARGSARAVGQALGRNPFPIIVPCHRVLAAGGKMGGFSAPGGVETKRRMLAIEGADGGVGTRTAPRGAERGLPGGVERFGFDPDLAVSALRVADPTLARLIERVGPCTMRIKDTSSLFFALAESIVYQQLTGKAAATIFRRLCELFPRAPAGLTPRLLLRAPDEKLRSAGLSRAKQLALRDLAERVEARELPTLEDLQTMDDEAIIESLTRVRGIGRWTVEMLLMFRLGRPDVLPLDDYGIRKGFGVAFRKRELPARKDVAKRGARWKPYRTVASWYLWRAAELGAP